MEPGSSNAWWVCDGEGNRGVTPVRSKGESVSNKRSCDVTLLGLFVVKVWPKEGL